MINTKGKLIFINGVLNNNNALKTNTVAYSQTGTLFLTQADKAKIGFQKVANRFCILMVILILAIVIGTIVMLPANIET